MHVVTFYMVTKIPLNYKNSQCPNMSEERLFTFFFIIFKVSEKMGLPVLFCQLACYLRWLKCQAFKYELSLNVYHEKILIHTYSSINISGSKSELIDTFIFTLPIDMLLFRFIYKHPPIVLTILMVTHDDLL